MAHRKFISFLGTSNYVQVYYGSASGTPTRFVQESLIDLLCKDWDEQDQILIFYTDGPDGSKAKNWEDNGQPEAIIKEDIERIGLKHILEEKKRNGLKPSIYSYIVPEGFSEEEVWQIFECIYSKLEDNDQIYFDVTHAFRSIPLFSTVLFNFSKYAHNTTLRGVYYGAFEKLGAAFIVRNIPLENRIAPIIDLTSIIDLQELTTTASDLRKYGRVGSISQLVLKTTSNLDKSKTSNRLRESLRIIKNCANNLENYIMANRMSDIIEGAYAREFNNEIDKAISSNKLNSAELEVFKNLKDLFSKFKPEKSYDNIESAIEWAQNYGMIQQAYTLAREYVITLCFEKLKEHKALFKDEKSFREFISSLLSIDIDTKESDYRNELAENKQLANNLLKKEWILRLRDHYQKLSNNRNTINHGKGKDKYEVLAEQFKTYYNECLKALGKCL